MALDAGRASSRFLDDYQVLLATAHLPDGPLRACDQRQAVTSRGESYIAGLVIGRPRDDGRPAETSVELANAGNRLANLVETTIDTIRVDLELVWASAPDVVVQRFAGLLLRDADVGLVSGRFQLVQDIPVDEPVSGLRGNGPALSGGRIWLLTGPSKGV